MAVDWRSYFKQRDTSEEHFRWCYFSRWLNVEADKKDSMPRDIKELGEKIMEITSVA